MVTVVDVEASAVVEVVIAVDVVALAAVVVAEVSSHVYLLHDRSLYMVANAPPVLSKCGQI